MFCEFYVYLCFMNMCVNFMCIFVLCLFLFSCLYRDLGAAEEIGHVTVPPVDLVLFLLNTCNFNFYFYSYFDMDLGAAEEIRHVTVWPVDLQQVDVVCP